MDEDQPVEVATRILEKYPLCDRCLGRLYARLGRGWSNKDRGRALKMSVLMSLHRQVLEGSEEAKARLEKVAINSGDVARELYKHVFGGEMAEAGCYICGSKLEQAIEYLSREASRLLKAYDARRIVVGARVGEDVVSREEGIKIEYKLEYGESIKAELRREIGKRLRDKYGYQVDFEQPDAMVIVGFPQAAIEIQNNSLLLRGKYWKLARMISQAYWPTPAGPKYYSVEEAAWGLLKLTGGDSIVLHAAGREDVDARMLGTGRPMILEVKNPRRRYLSIEELEEAANKSARGLVRFKFTGRATRREVQLYKEEAAGVAKTYRALILTYHPVSGEDLRLLEDQLKGATINQWTPRRVLHRRRNIMRRRKVLDIKCKRLHGNLVECLIKAEGGLYIKELVSGDEGRTSPSISSILGTEAVCIELDVLGVEVPGVEVLEQRTV